MRFPTLETDVQVPALLAKFAITVEAVVLLADVVVTARLSLRHHWAPWPLSWSGRTTRGVVQALTFLAPIFPAIAWLVKHWAYVLGSTLAQASCRLPTASCRSFDLGPPRMAI